MTDEYQLSGSEETDEDELSVDPLERGMEPPERWAEADHFGMTPREQREGEPLEQRLQQEQRDTRPEDLHYAGELGDNEIIQGQIEELGQLPETPMDNSDRAGGSVAESLREPDESG
jgi:hypothetical protein